MSRCCCPTSLSNGAPAGSSSPAARVVSVEYDFADQGTIVLANGPQVIVDTDGNPITATVAQVGNAATFRFLQGTGLQFIASVANTSYTSAAQTAPNLEFTLANLFTTYDVDATHDILVRIYATVQTFPTANVSAGLVFGIRGVAGSPSNSAARLRGVIRSNQVATQVYRHGTDGSGGQNYVPGVVPNVYGMLFEGGAASPSGGTWAGSFDDTPMTQDVSAQPSTSANTSGYRDALNILYLAFGTGNANADVQVTIERMRLDFRAAA